MHTTNYTNTFIEIAEDSPKTEGAIPKLNPEKMTVADHQFQILRDHPYEFTSDDVIFDVFAIRKEIPSHERAAAREEFYSKGQPCFRASPLTKTHGWGIHNDANGKIAMFAAGTEEYKRFLNDPSIEKVKAMRSKRA